MSFHFGRSAAALLVGAGLLSCADAPTAPEAPQGAAFSHSVALPQVLISQVYGGGGNSGATLKNDFIELFNPGSQPVSVAGWSVQYASAAGSTWQKTDLTGTIQPGGYYLIQQAAGAGGTVDLPQADANGSIPMAAGAGKVWLVSSTTTLSGTCPTADVVDKVSFGTTATDCGFGTTATINNTTAAIRNNSGCAYSQHLSADFTNGPPAPRNSDSPTQSCSMTQLPPASVSVDPSPASAGVGSTLSFAATARDMDGNVVTTTVTWTSSDETVATIDQSGLATAVKAGTTTITATTANGITGGSTLTVTPPPAAGVVISQVYGGGGNSGATYRNDFIELFNRGDEPVSVTGWSVQYASATGSSWQVAPLAGTILPGHYYLVQLAPGAGGTTDLPAPDATGGINMSGTAGKVVLVRSTEASSGTCPAGVTVVDRISFGGNATDCGPGTTPALSNTTAAFRKNDGCVVTGSAGDFDVLAPNPRNSASPRKNCTQPPRPPSDATIIIKELMVNPVNAESASWGQWFEVHNHGSTPVDLKDWTIISDGTSQPDHTISSSVIVPAGGYAVLGRGADMGRNGGVELAYNYFVGNAATIWLDAADYLMLVDAAGARVDSVAWTSMPRGVTKGLRSAAVRSPDVNGTAWGYSTTTFGAGDYGTPGAGNGALADTPPFVSPNSISVGGRTSTDAPLPVGFESQLFATERDGSNQVVETTFTWTSLTPSIASVDSRGVIRALAPGLAIFRVVSAGGAARNHSLVMETPVASTTSDYRDQTEFGVPTDSDPSDDFIVRRPQLVTSWNGGRGIPNWVAYNLNRTHIAPGQDRCNCFTFDPVLEGAGFAPYNTADYTGVGGTNPFHGYAIDRGHLARSFDRTAGTLDNAISFYFSNIVPQAADLNQGPWAVLENHLGNLATAQDKEVFIYAGVTGSKGTVKNEGRITIPEYNWKVALIMPRGYGLADVRDYRDLEVIAVVMPNAPGIRNVNWQSAYVVTTDSVESLSGYRLLTALPGNIQRAVKSGTMPPIAKVNGPFTTREGSPVIMSGAQSVDPNGAIVSYRWLPGDGSTGTGSTYTHTYAERGTYAVRLVVTDNHGLVDTATTTATVAAILPADGLQNLREHVNALALRRVINSGEATSLLVKVQAATVQLQQGSMATLVNQIESFVNEVDAMERAGRLSSADAEKLRFEARRLIRAVVS